MQHCGLSLRDANMFSRNNCRLPILRHVCFQLLKNMLLFLLLVLNRLCHYWKYVYYLLIYLFSRGLNQMQVCCFSLFDRSLSVCAFKAFFERCSVPRAGHAAHKTSSCLLETTDTEHPWIGSKKIAKCYQVTTMSSSRMDLQTYWMRLAGRQPLKGDWV